MVKIILNREQLTMVLGWIGQAEVDAKEVGIPWDEFENEIKSRFNNALFTYKDMKIRRE